MARLDARWGNFDRRGQTWDSWWQDGPAAASESHSGSGTLTLVPTITATGTRAAGGTGTLTLVSSLAQTGDKTGTGTASLTLVPSLTETARKDTAGAGSLELVGSLVGTGLSSEVPAFVDTGGSLGSPVRLLRLLAETEHHEGKGALSLTARLAGAGFKSYEADDELVLALAA